MFSGTMAESYEQLVAMTDDEIRSRYDYLARDTTLGLGFYREELHRRAVDRQTETLVSLTRGIFWLTVCVAVLTAVNVLLVLAALFVA